mmetsp:Transcript_63804/g.103352  ORF Transcript_63804/g.103352 Transcript_63804/m.103352 type:complete len:117 (+) Transcript_63804:66-416(+)
MLKTIFIVALRKLRAARFSRIAPSQLLLNKGLDSALLGTVFGSTAIANHDLFSQFCGSFCVQRIIQQLCGLFLETNVRIILRLCYWTCADHSSFLFLGLLRKPGLLRIMLLLGCWV